MKKLLSLILILIIAASSVCGAEYEIKWHETSLEGIFVLYPEQEYLIVSDGFCNAVYDMEFNPVSNSLYTNIYPLDNKSEYFLARGKVLVKKSRNEETDGPLTDEMFYGYYNIVENDEVYEYIQEIYNAIGKPYGENGIEVSIEDIRKSSGELVSRRDIAGFINEEYRQAYSSMIKLCSYYDSKSQKYALGTADERLTGYEFDKRVYMDSNAPGYVWMANDNKAIIGDIFTGKWKTIDSIEDVIYEHNSGTAFVEKTKEGKYRYYHYDLEPVSEFCFDKYNGSYYSSAAFEKDGLNYIYDKNGNLGYCGKEDVKAVFYGNYLKGEEESYGLYDKNGIEIIPPVYENIRPICENVFIALKSSGEDHLYNQGKIVASANLYGSDQTLYMESETYVHYVNPGYVCGYIGDSCVVYDLEGNELFKTDQFKISSNGSEIFVTDSDNKRIGKVIFSDTNPNIRINGKLLVSDTMPRIENGRTLVPLRALAEETGFEVKYDEKTKEILILKEDKEIKFTIGGKKAYKNGEEIILEASPKIINGRTLVPVRAVSDAFGYDIDWNGERRLVEINYELPAA